MASLPGSWQDEGELSGFSCVSLIKGPLSAVDGPSFDLAGFALWNFLIFFLAFGVYIFLQFSMYSLHFYIPCIFS